MRFYCYNISVNHFYSLIYFSNIPKHSLESVMRDEANNHLEVHENRNAETIIGHFSRGSK